MLPDFLARLATLLRPGNHEVTHSKGGSGKAASFTKLLDDLTDDPPLNQPDSQTVVVPADPACFAATPPVETAVPSTDLPETKQISPHLFFAPFRPDAALHRSAGF
jgi:hypothetical protein